MEQSILIRKDRYVNLRFSMKLTSFDNNKRFIFIIIALLLIPYILYAHGTKYEIYKDGVVGVKVMFHSGNPMIKARALIFRPGEAEFCNELTSDRNGIICFAPDKPGLWIIQVRDKTGHGMRINLKVDESMTASPKQQGAVTGLSLLQKIVMTACLLWGLVGTALYFKGRQGR